MSWITGLAGKAEEFLNKVDSQAATALQHPDEPDPFKWKPPPKQTAQPNYSPFLGQPPMAKPIPSNMMSSASVPSNLNKMNSESGNVSQLPKPAALNSTQPSSGRQSPTQSNGKSNDATPPAQKKTQDKDAELFEFLNSSENNAEKKKLSTSKLSTNGKHSRHSSTSSTTSRGSAKTSDIMGRSDTPPTDRDGQHDNGSNGESTHTYNTDTSSDILLTEGSSSGYHSNQEDSSATQQQLSALELENRLLKNEIESLNQEMSSALQRARTAQDDLQHVKRTLSQQHLQMSQGDQLIRELQGREGDLQEALKAKDSQLAILRVRLDEADRDLRGKKNLIDDITADKNRILDDHTSASGVQGQALESLKNKLQDSEHSLRHEKEVTKKNQEESMARQSQLEAEKHQLSTEISNLQKKMNDEKSKSKEISIQVKTAKINVETAKQELTEYKDKATRILQSKDKLISSLKDGTSGGDGDVSAAEMDGLRQERDMIREELQRSQMTIENLRTEIGELEVQLSQDSEAAQDQLNSLEEQLGAERKRREESESEVNKQKQELKYAHEELVRQKTGLQSRLQDREGEIDRLRNQLMTKSLSSSSEEELENRLHTLTESLIQKQTMLESLSTEKNSLGLQLERMEKMYKEAEASAVRATSTSVNMNEDDEAVRQRIPNFMHESPLDSQVARRVKRYANTIDRFSIRLGVFLRRYPIARIFVIMYMILLHVWVMIVLLTYQPEIHGHDYQPHISPGSQPQQPK